MSYTADAAHATKPPANVDAEQALLGAILINNEAAHGVSGFLLPEHFSEPVHGRIYRAALQTIDAGRPANPVTLRVYFERDEALSQVGGAGYLARLSGAAVTVIDCRHYGRTIYELAQRRAIIDACEDGIARAAEPSLDEPTEAIVEAIEAGLAGARESDGGHRAVTASTALDAALAAADGARERRGITTGLADLDSCIGGLHPRKYLVLAGRTSMGKSGIGISMSRAAAGAGAGVAFFSLEMAAEDIGLRLATDIAWDRERRIAYSDIMKGIAEPWAFERARQARAEIDRLPLVINDRAGLTVAAIRSEARRLARQFDRQGTQLGLIVVDHITKVRDSGRNRDNMVARVGEISNDLASLAKDLDCCVLALCQISRQVEGRDDKRPTLADLRWSGDIEQDADVVMFAFREAYYLERKLSASTRNDERVDIEADLAKCRNTLELIVAKQRMGPTPTVTVFCDMAANAFRNAARGGGCS